MNDTDEQSKLWNGTAGRAWAENQEVLDAMFKPFEDLLVEAVVASSARQVLDVGCGTGSTTLAIARRLGAMGNCTGIDISEPMLATARARAEQEGIPAHFIRANAQSHAFEPATFDRVISRFGVMFFEDPVQAFANLRRAAKTDAKLLAIAWRSPSENPFMTTAERAAAPLVPNLPVRQPDAPGQFAFADSNRVHRILEESGWTGIDIQPIDVTCTLPEKELVHYLTRFGLLARVLQEVDETTRARVIETVRAAFEPFVHGAEVRYTAACWKVAASP
ncbi:MULTISPECIES: class I SAM-dependent methyltransferase [unclassified Corallococcus]|uniref:class I SAM-dependent methyltransferase n=1 Tax=unclassified Corallococcus TaxID=2685029 RepID=UPI001A8DC241|nr:MULTISPECIES: class I SAM-dependent methyltransferase [unclassified Corallococcus]MBN9682626.1 class I SAM-dependent methyltransferase [Corallococcus sp. NCSPR001]WAS85829.1 class I SAM-dependent methyltransferase [Corallococcus sp. NCRR]